MAWTCALFFLVICMVVASAQKGCPPQEDILPCRCLLKGEEFQVWCSHSDLPTVLEGLRAIGQLIPDPIGELILESNHLPSLPGRAFVPLRVMRLMLRYNGLERVSSDWLVGLESSLMELFIVEPDLRSLPQDCLHHATRLEAVTIKTNLLKRLPHFNHLPKLKYLQLESLSLLEIAPSTFRNLPVLQTIHISNSPRLTRLEGGLFEDFPRLGLVNMSYCGIHWMHPRAISRLPSLKELSLVGNKIVDVGMVGRAVRDSPLEVLRLDHNYIDVIGEAAFVDLPTLKKIFLSNNHINELQYGAFHRVPQLKTLDLNNNMVRRVHPESFLQQSGSGLEELWLINNDISHVAELRSLLDTLPRLTFLDLSFNSLEAIPFGALRGHPTLERLHLDYNKIHVIDNEAFMAMPALRELRLKNNSLSEILEGPLWNLPELKGLDLSGNYYRRLEPRLLANLPSLRRVDLSQNEIVFVDPDAFILNKALEHVNLSHNALPNLHPATFRHLLSLYDLDVSYNDLMEIVPNLPRGIEYLHSSHNRILEIPAPPSPDLDLPALRMLDIAHNTITQIPGNSLRSMPQLRRFYLGNNALQRLDENSLAGLGRLETVDFPENKIALIHPNSLNKMEELKHLNLRNNHLDVLFPEIFKDTINLKRLDVSGNQLAEILPGTLDKTRHLQEIDASNNLLVQLPPNLFGMKSLKVLDLTNNRLKNLHPETLASLESLRELRLARNYIQELKQGAFDGLQHLRLLHLQSNEVEVIEANAIRLLPVLKTLNLSNNKLKDIPDYAFNDLVSLHAAELQDNHIRSISSNAFHLVPHLLMLNLSRNNLMSLEEVGLQGLKSLEMLDVSSNRIARVEEKNFEKMEWLVELKMNDNSICTVHGSPFDGMPRLRVLNMRNNRMMTLSEQSVQKLRTNIAVLDLDGNPLVCSCGLLWLQAWLQEASSMGPRCEDGTLVREMRMSRDDCSAEERSLEVVAPGCESELLSAPGNLDTSQVWMSLKSNVSRPFLEKKNQLAPSPEESEYFYDEYVDYPYNTTNKSVEIVNTTPGNTPTLYAAPKNKTIPKGVSNSPSTSGFTFFGVPLPSLNLNNLWGKAETPKSAVAERKVAIVNSPIRTGARGSLGLPTEPEIHSGGFIPLLPGSGGFKPILNPLLSSPFPPTEPVPVTQFFLDRKEGLSSMGHPLPTAMTTPTSTSSTTTAPVVEIKVEQAQIEEITEVPVKKIETTTSSTTTTIKPELETSISSNNGEKLDDLFGESVQSEAIVEVSSSTTSTTTTEVVPTEPKKMATPLSALLVPGGLQPDLRHSGRPTITKVPSPHVSGSAPLLASLEVADVPEPQPHNRGSKTPKDYLENIPIESQQENSWYFANYNKSNLEPYVGVGNGGSDFGLLAYWKLALIQTILKQIL